MWWFILSWSSVHSVSKFQNKTTSTHVDLLIQWKLGLQDSKIRIPKQVLSTYQPGEVKVQAGNWPAFIFAGSIECVFVNCIMNCKINDDWSIVLLGPEF